MRKMFIGLFAALLIAVSAPSVVLAQGSRIIDATTPDSVAEIARRYGSADQATDALGDPMVQAQLSSGVYYDIYFYGCTNAANCRNLQFVATWDYKGASADEVMRWNREKRFGKAYLNDEGNLVVEMNVNIDYGVTDRNFDDTIDWWRVVVDEFVTFFRL